MNYGKNLKANQKQPSFDRNDQVKNNAGGYVFKIDDWKILERFLILGSEGGTYYASEQKMTVDNAKTIISLIKKDGKQVLNHLLKLHNRAPKKDPSLFVLALLATYGDEVTKTDTYDAIKLVCKTSTHLFTFLANIHELRGWSSGLRRGVSNFYLSKTPEQVAYQMVKYRQRNGWTHRDVLRLAHPKTDLHQMNNLFKYAVGKLSVDETCSIPLINSFEKAQLTKDPEELASLIQECGLTWEMVPTEMLKDVKVLKALLKDMPLTATMRNLNRVTIAGLFDSNISQTTRQVVDRLTNVELIKAANLHPVNVLNSLATYNQGRGFKGSLSWEPNQRIVDALEETFELSFSTVEPTNKNLLVAVDVSGSMDAQVNNSALTAKEIAAALSLTLVKSEPNVDLIWFDTQVYKPKTGKRSSYAEVIKHTPRGGGTDCSLAFSYALQTKQKYDAIIIITDNETWAGNEHTHSVYEQYKRINPNVKNIVLGTTATQYGILKEGEHNVLHIAGYDSAVPQLINNFIKE